MQKVLALAAKAKGFYDEIHPKVKAGGKVGIVATAVVAVAEAVGISVPDPSGAANALVVLAGAAIPVISGWLKRA